VDGGLRLEDELVMEPVNAGTRAPRLLYFPEPGRFFALDSCPIAVNPGASPGNFRL
jgi:hypothetical protein